MRFLPYASLLILLILPSSLKSTPPLTDDSTSQDGRLSQHQAIPVASDDGANESSAKSTEENLTLDQLKETLRIANDTARTWQKEVFFAQRDLKEKMEQAKEPNRIYDNSKKEYERLKVESDRIASDWNANKTNAKKMKIEFEDLERKSKAANDTVKTNSDNLDQKKEEAAKALEKLNVMKGITAQKQNLTNLIAAMDNGKPELVKKVAILKQNVTSKEDIMEEQKRLLESRTDKAAAQQDVAKATREWEEAKEILKEPDAELITFDGRRRALEIKESRLKVPTDSAMFTAQENVNDTKADEDFWQGEVDKTTADAANLTSQLNEQREDYEIAKKFLNADKPPEVDAAIKKSDRAWLAFEEARIIKEGLEIEIGTINASLHTRQNELNKATQKVDGLQTRYDTAKRKAKLPEGPGGATVGGAVAGVVLLIVAFISIGICYKRKMVCFAGRKAAKGKEGAASMKTARETASQAPAAATPGAAQPPDQASARPTDSAAAKPGSDPNSARKTEPTQKSDPPVPVLNLNTSAAANHLADELVSEPPEPTGQTTFKV